MEVSFFQLLVRSKEAYGSTNAAVATSFFWLRNRRRKAQPNAHHVVVVVGFSPFLSFFFSVVSASKLSSRGCTHVSQLRCISSIGFSRLELHLLWRLENRRAPTRRRRRNARWAEATTVATTAEDTEADPQQKENLLVVVVLHTVLLETRWPLGLICYSIS